MTPILGRRLETDRRHFIGRVGMGFAIAVFASPCTTIVFAGDRPDVTEVPNAKPVAKPEVTVVESSFTVAPCGRGTLSITIQIKEGWRISSITQQQLTKRIGPLVTRIMLKPSNSYRVCGAFTTNAKLHVSRDEEFWPGLKLEEHSGTVTWRAHTITRWD